MKIPTKKEITESAINFIIIISIWELMQLLPTYSLI